MQSQIMVKEMKTFQTMNAVLAVLFLAAGCSPSLTAPSGAPVVSGTNSGSASSVQSPAGQTTPDLDLPQALGTQGQPPVSGPVSIEMVTPQDGATVNTPQIQVTGVSSPGAVVTVNDDILIAGPDGKFETTVSLEEGPNLIEIVASNDSGSETSLELTVTYEP